MITYKTKQEITTIREGGKRLSEILDKVVAKIAPGVSTEVLENVAVEEMHRMGGEPSFKGYTSMAGETPFPTALCTSVNDVVVHSPAIPGTILQEGDIISIDIGMRWPMRQKNITPLYTDMARTVPVGTIAHETQKLLQVTKESLMAGITAAKIGATIGHISRAIEEVIKPHGYGIVRDLVGHGVGYAVHEDPYVPNFFDPRFSDIPLKKGMVLAIEPMVTLGGYAIRTLDDHWTIVTEDGSLVAHFEHTLAVEKNGGDILT